MRTKIEGIYAVGDIASFPLRNDGKLVNIGHWSMALHHGRKEKTTPLILSKHHDPFYFVCRYCRFDHFGSWATHF